MKSEPENDRIDFALLRQGDEEALARLIGRWERPLFSFAWRYLQNAADARDLVAELFVRLYQQRQRLREDTRLSAWLFTSLSNLCHNQVRWRRRHPALSLDLAGAPAWELADPSQPGAAAAFDRDEDLAVLAAAIERLPHDLKVTLLLHYYQSLSHREIGAAAGCSERGVESRLYRARQQLRAALACYRSGRK
ncbi:MAG TPA: RNA polymerase sigma factor [Opitutaceae bacterium]|nr:RNA polymerase sigma factor [Opitutaceae bacterium]